jgi:hypothetical protein
MRDCRRSSGFARGNLSHSHDCQKLFYFIFIFRRLQFLTSFNLDHNDLTTSDPTCMHLLSSLPAEIWLHVLRAFQPNIADILAANPWRVEDVLLTCQRDLKAVSGTCRRLFEVAHPLLFSMLVMRIGPKFDMVRGRCRLDYYTQTHIAPHVVYGEIFFHVGADPSISVPGNLRQGIVLPVLENLCKFHNINHFSLRDLHLSRQTLIALGGMTKPLPSLSLYGCYCESLASVESRHEVPFLVRTKCLYLSTTIDSTDDVLGLCLPTGYLLKLDIMYRHWPSVVELMEQAPLHVAGMKSLTIRQGLGFQDRHPNAITLGQALTM